MHGGDRIAEVLKVQGVPFVFTLCGGHISPILTGCKQRGIRVVDTRHEATTVFAADAVARLTGVPGVAAVTAGPGVTNTLTAVKNAQLAQSPVVILGGATATALKGRGALQDIDQMALMKPHVKRARSARRVRELGPLVRNAFQAAQAGAPGPVFLECPVDLLYDEALVREWYGLKAEGGGSLSDRALKWYLQRHLKRLFAEEERQVEREPVPVEPPEVNRRRVQAAAEKLRRAERPVLLVGSQALLDVPHVQAVAEAVTQLGVPVYLSGMARGLLGKAHPLQLRHQRRQALKQADLVILAGVPCDFRLDYGRHIRRGATLISANRSPRDLKRNRRPNVGVLGDPGRFLRELASVLPGNGRWQSWLQELRQRDEAREAEIREKAAQKGERVNPVRLCLEIEQVVGEDAMLVADGGDFVATASYTVRPPAPLTWLDPGVFGTLGVGAGFALGAKLCRPDAEVWVLYGDGSVGYSLMEFDTFVRHGIPVLAVVGNDACWAQIAREQVEILHDDVGTVLRHTDYHRAAEACGGKGYVVKKPEEISDVLQQAKRDVAEGHPVLVNVHLDKTDFRKGSISM